MADFFIEQVELNVQPCFFSVSSLVRRILSQADECSRFTIVLNQVDHFYSRIAQVILATASLISRLRFMISALSV